MDSEPAIDEIRAIRHRISARFGHDPARLVAHYMEFQKQFADRFVKAPKPAAASHPGAPVQRPADENHGD